MIIRLNYVALESDRLPEDGNDQLDLQDGASVSDAMKIIGMSEDHTFLTLLNDTSVPRTERDASLLKDGDILTLFSPIKGG
jgi:sulfur carrier protein ThiS